MMQYQLLFCVIVFVGFYLFWNKRINLIKQHCILLLLSIVFYCILNVYFIPILPIIIYVNYFFGKKIEQDINSNYYLRLGLLFNVLLVIISKVIHFNFYGFSFENFYLLGILFLPLRSIAYLLDIKRKNVKAEQNIILFSVFILFFPFYILGPIITAKKSFLKLNQKQQFNRIIIVDGFRQILWGSFKVFVIAANSAIISNQVFGSLTKQTPIDLGLGILFFTFQIYGYLSGYNDIALGICKLFGFRFKANFKSLFLLLSSHRFWNNWYISLHRWFVYYIVLPIVKFNCKTSKNILAVVLSFLISGLLFIPSYNFIYFILINSIIVLGLNCYKINRNTLFFKVIRVMINISIILFNVLLIKSDSFQIFLTCINKLIDYANYGFPHLNKNALAVLFLLIFLILMEWFGKLNQHALEKFLLKSTFWLRWSFYSLLIMLIILFN